MNIPELDQAPHHPELMEQEDFHLGSPGQDPHHLRALEKEHHHLVSLEQEHHHLGRVNPLKPGFKVTCAVTRCAARVNPKTENNNALTDSQLQEVNLPASGQGPSQARLAIGVVFSFHNRE